MFLNVRFISRGSGRLAVRKPNDSEELHGTVKALSEGLGALVNHASP